MTEAKRKTIIGAAGAAILLLALGALLLPMQHDIPGRVIVGWLLIAAGAIEGAAAAARRRHRPTAAIAAIATLLIGIRMIVDPVRGFLPVMNLVILWLVVRGAALLFASARSRPPLAGWLGLAAATDLTLAIALLVGLPIALLVVGLFGPTPQIIATFAWVFGFSFIATGVLLLAIAFTGEARDAD